MPPHSSPVDDRLRYDFYLSAAPTGAILPAGAASSSAKAAAGVDAGALANAVFAGVEKRARGSGRLASMFYAPRSVGGSYAESYDAILQTRGGGVALFLLTIAFFRSEQCVNELLSFLHLRKNAKYGEESELRFACIGMTPDELRQEPTAQALMSRLAGFNLHFVALSTLPAMAGQIVKLVLEVWQSASFACVLGATRQTSLADLLLRFPETDSPIAAGVLGVEDPTASRMAEILHNALSSRMLGGGGDTRLLQDIVTLGSGLRSDSKRMAVEAFSRKWESSDSWEWDAIARDELEGICVSSPESRVPINERAIRPRMVAPRNPSGVLLDYNDASTLEGRLKRILLNTASSSDMVTVANCPSSLTSVYGMDGVGKTCALRGLCFDHDVWQRFPDGIFFFTLGKDATATDVIMSLTRIVKALEKDVDVQAIRGCENVKAAVDVTAQALSGLQCLLLFDDLWSTDSYKCGHLEELQHLVDSCELSHILFSTRSQTIACRAGQNSISFESRDEETSKRILLGFTGLTEAEVRAMSAEAIEALIYALKKCAGLPIALAVTGRLIRFYVSRLADQSNKSRAWRLYKSYAAKHSGSYALGGRVDAGEHPGLSEALQQSLDEMDSQLKCDGKEYIYSAADMYRALCVLRKQSWAPLSMLCALWSLDAELVAHVAEEFESLSLLSIRYAQNDDTDDDNEGSSPQMLEIKLHDLALDFCKQQVRALGSTEEKWHAALLCGYLPHQKTPPSLLWQQLIALFMWKHPLAQPRPWWSVASDGYLSKNLAHHLVESRAFEELIRLLLDFRWMLLQVREDGIWHMMQDYEYVIDFLLKTHEPQGDIARNTHLPAFKAIDGALRMAWPIISSRPEQLAFQLAGRLYLLKKKNDSVAQFLKSVDEHAPAPWLRPMSRSLSVPNPALRMAIPVKRAHSAALAPGTDIAVTSGGDGLSHVLNISTGRTIHELTLRDVEVHCVTAYITGATAMIASGGKDGKLRFWYMETGVAAGKHIDASERQVLAVAVSKDGLFVISGSSNGEVRRWSTETREAAGALNISKPAMAVAVSTDGRRVAVGTARKGEVWVWSLDRGSSSDAASATLLHTYDSLVTTVAISADGSIVVSGGRYDNAIHVWRVGNKTATEDQITTASGVTALVIHGSKIYCGLFDGSILVHDIHSRKLLKELSQTRSMSLLSSLDASADGRRLISCAGDGLVRIWDLERENEWAGGQGWAWSGFPKSVSCITASPDRQWVVSGHCCGGVCLWDAAKGEVGDEPLVGNGSKSVCCMTVSPDSGRVVYGDRIGVVRVLDINSRLNVLGELRGHDKVLHAVAISTDGKCIASCSGDATVRLWSMESGVPVCGPLEGHLSPVVSVAFSTDCRYVVSGSEDCDVRVWDSSNGAAVGQPLGGHVGRVRHVGVSGDSLRIVSRCKDEVRVWCLGTGECERVLKDGDPLFHSSVEVLTTPDINLVAHDSARLSLSDADSRHVVLGHPSSEVVVGSFDCRVSSWHYDSERKRLWAGLSEGGMGIVYMK